MTVTVASSRQKSYMDSLSAKAIQNLDDQWEYAERVAKDLGYVDEHGIGDVDAYSAATRDQPLTSRQAHACIEILKDMASQQRCSGYCGQRGVQHSTVRYYDDHYDYECGLS
jgi:hypothetical protein